jgi:uncharacterized protein YaaQ
MSVDETIYKARKKDKKRKYFRAAGLTTVAGFVAVICTFMFGVNKKLIDNPKSVKNLAPHMIFLKYFIKWFSKKK